MNQIDALVGLASGSAWGASLVFLRVMAAMTVMPALGEQIVSVRFRLLIGLVITTIITPSAVAGLTLPPPTLVNFSWALATETISGVFLGLMLRLFILAMQTAGAIAAQSTSLSQILGQAGADPLPAMGHILTVSALALLMATGFHVKVAAFLILSYEILPPLTFPDPSSIADAGSARVAHSFALAFSLAAPFVILSVLYNLTLGVINKAMPQLMVAFVGAPAITLGAIVLLMLCAPLMLTVWLAAIETFLVNPFG